MHSVDCPWCDGPSYSIGTLGLREHFRCRNCGWPFSVERTPENAPDWMQDDTPIEPPEIEGD